MASRRTVEENRNVKIKAGCPPHEKYEEDMCGGWSEWGPAGDDQKELTELVCI